ncbi:hypothetical protein EDC01DRAFT_464989 [Geopyxis carbonaria]|nr:hypothetical protein EDC01DRAFT_464989 [Geopyxis carbonaria]
MHILHRPPRRHRRLGATLTMPAYSIRDFRRASPDPMLTEYQPHYSFLPNNTNTNNFTVPEPPPQKPKSRRYDWAPFETYSNTTGYTPATPARPTPARNNTAPMPPPRQRTARRRSEPVPVFAPPQHAQKQGKKKVRFAATDNYAPEQAAPQRQPRSFADYFAHYEQRRRSPHRRASNAVPAEEARRWSRRAGGSAGATGSGRQPGWVDGSAASVLSGGGGGAYGGSSYGGRGSGWMDGSAAASAGLSQPAPYVYNAPPPPPVPSVPGYAYQSPNIDPPRERRRDRDRRHEERRRQREEEELARHGGFGGGGPESIFYLGVPGQAPYFLRPGEKSRFRKRREPGSNRRREERKEIPPHQSRLRRVKRFFWG